MYIQNAHVRQKKPKWACKKNPLNTDMKASVKCCQKNTNKFRYSYKV